MQRAFVGRAERDAGVILPGYTHLQRAQPVLAAHYWLAYCEKLERDRERLADCRRRVNQLPLGTAALAGTSIPIDRHMVAEELDFEGIVANSLDASSDRDFVLEFAFCLALIAVHLSTWAEEWILWSTTEFGFLRLPQAFCTGSSIMPQKINPDVLELIRGKTARVDRQPHGAAGAREGSAAGLQPRPAGRQGAAVRLGRHGRSVPGTGRAVVAGAELNREAIAARLDRGLPRRHDADGTPHHAGRAAADGPRDHRPAGRHRDEARRAARRAAARRVPGGPPVARQARVRRARRRARRRSVHQLRLHQPRTSRPSTRPLARTTCDEDT